MSKTLSAKYNQENKEKQQGKACKRYRNLSKEEKEKRQQYGCERYKNLSQDERKSMLSIEKNIIGRIIKSNNLNLNLFRFKLT